MTTKVLVIAKPDLVIRRGPGAKMLRGFMERTGCRITASSKMQISKELADMHYASLKGRPFYPWLMDYITMYDSFVFLMETEKPIAELRDTLGSTMVEKAERVSLRGMYGLAKGMNGMHLSESEEAAKQEVNLWLESSALKEGSIGFDAEAYIGKYIDSPDNTQAIHRLLGDGDEKNKIVAGERNEALYDMLKEEAAEVKHEAVSKLYSVLAESLKS